MNFEHLGHTKEQFIKVANEQERKGILKYGKPLDPTDDYDWLQMAEEELVDGFKYLEAERVKRQLVVGRIQRLLEPSTLSKWVKDEVNHLLDQL